jgi:hypothetical protein
MSNTLILIFKTAVLQKQNNYCAAFKEVFPFHLFIGTVGDSDYEVGIAQSV